MSCNTFNEVIDIDRETEVPVFVGTSLGAYWAYRFATAFNSHFVVANPSFFPKESLKKYLNDEEVYIDFGGNEHVFKEAWLNAYHDLDFDYPRPKSGVALLCKGDEVLGHTWKDIESLLHDKYEVHYLEGGNHRFEDMNELVNGIDEVVEYSINLGIDENHG